MARLPETTRIARVLEIIWLISNAPREWTRKKLALKFEVSERTITSDLEMIRHRLRFDIESDRGSGYRFTKLPKLPEVAYSIPEALALILAAQVGAQFSGIPQHDLASAIARLASVIPPELRRMVDRIGIGGDGEEDRQLQQRLGACSEAIAMSRSLDMTYAAASHGGELSTRRIDPYALFPYIRSWHIVGYCHLREDIRIFKVDRIRTAALTNAHFEVRDGFDLAAFLSSGWGLIRGVDAPLEEVVLRFRPPAAQWVAEERWHASQLVEWQPDGTMTFRVTIRVTPEFQRWVFRYGRDVDVVAPDALREWVIDEASAVVARSQPSLVSA